MSNREPKVADVEKESLYGYVFGVSGPGKLFILGGRSVQPPSCS